MAHQSVFDAVPDAGLWRCALLLDGSIGIGGDPEALLQRVESGSRSTADCWWKPDILSNRPSTSMCGSKPPRAAARGFAGRSFLTSTWGCSPVPAVSFSDAWEDEGRYFAQLDRRSIPDHRGGHLRS